MSGNVYDAVVEACGLAPLLAADVIGRVCAREKLETTTLTAADLARLMPALEKALKLYLGPIALKQAVARLRALTTSGSEAKSAR